MNLNEVLAKEIHKQRIKKFKRRKFNARFNDNVWAVDLAQTGSLHSFYRGIKCLLLETDLSTKYVCVKKYVWQIKRFFMVLLKW